MTLPPFQPRYLKSRTLCSRYRMSLPLGRLQTSTMVDLHFWEGKKRAPRDALLKSCEQTMAVHRCCRIFSGVPIRFDDAFLSGELCHYLRIALVVWNPHILGNFTVRTHECGPESCHNVVSGAKIKCVKTLRAYVGMSLVEAAETSRFRKNMICSRT